jgi:hypothetical protein
MDRISGLGRLKFVMEHPPFLDPVEAISRFGASSGLHRLPS